MKTPARAVVLLGFLVATAACRKPSEQTSTTHVTSSPAASAPKVASPETAAGSPKKFVPSHTVPPFTGAFPHKPEPNAEASGRVVSIKFVRNGGDGDIAPVFALTNLTKETVTVGQTWIYYYDEKKKQKDRYPHHLGSSFELAPGETKEQRLGQRIEKIAKGISAIEGEVTRATVGGKAWRNENLVDTNRPFGGRDLQALEDMAGERLVVDVYALASDRVRLTNVTDRTVKSADIKLHYVDAKGETSWRSAYSQDLPKPLGPGESVDFQLKTSGSNTKLPNGALKVVAFASGVTFTDGPSFKNDNLLEPDGWLALALPKK